MFKVFFIAIVCAGPLLADDTKPATTRPDVSKSPWVTATEAIQKHDLAETKAKQILHDSVVAADKQLVDDLNAILADTMKEGPSRIDEVKRIDAAKEIAKDYLDAATKGAGRPAPHYCRYQWGKASRKIELVPDGTIVFSEGHNPDIGKNERRWELTSTGLKFFGEMGGVELFLCADGNYRGTGHEGESVVLSPEDCGKLLR
jgi:hypothetical protein